MSSENQLVIPGLSPGRYENVTLVVAKKHRGNVIAKVDGVVVYIGRKSLRVCHDILDHTFTNEDREAYAKLAGVSGYSIKQLRMKREVSSLKEMEAEEIEQARKILKQHGFEIYKPEPNPSTEHSA